MTWTDSLNQWREFESGLRQRVDRLDAMIDREARQTAKLAGIDPQICYLHAHNALVSFNSGHPWEEVNYSLVRKVRWLEERRNLVFRLYDRISARAYNRFVAKMHNVPDAIVYPR